VSPLTSQSRGARRERPARRAAVRRRARSVRGPPGRLPRPERLATERGPDVESPAVPTAGSDPDADEYELFYPDDVYTDSPDAGAWVDPPVASARRGCSVLTTRLSPPRHTRPGRSARRSDRRQSRHPRRHRRGAIQTGPSSSSTCSPARRASASPESRSRSAPRSTAPPGADFPSAALSRRQRPRDERRCDHVPVGHDDIIEPVRDLTLGILGAVDGRRLCPQREAYRIPDGDAP
jgi:hypothetical protein